MKYFEIEEHYRVLASCSNCKYCDGSEYEGVYCTNPLRTFAGKFEEGEEKECFCTNWELDNISLVELKTHPEQLDDELFIGNYNLYDELLISYFRNNHIRYRAGTTVYTWRGNHLCKETDSALSPIFISRQDREKYLYYIL